MKATLCLLLVLLSNVISAEKDGTIMVRKPAMTSSIEVEKMNVFYIGVENPINVSVSGVYPSDIVVSLMGSGRISGAMGKYMVNVTAGKEALISVGVRQGGKTKTVDTKSFRVKQLPTPVAYLGGVSSGAVKKSVILASPVIIPKMENFDFDLKIGIVSFEVTGVRNGDLRTIVCKGAVLNEQQLELIRTTKNNGRVYIENIKALMPNGTTRTLPPINLKVLI